MSIESLLQGGPGFLFLHPTQSEIQRALADAGVRLPTPPPIFLEGEKPTAFRGFLMVETPELQRFEAALAQALDATTERLVRQRRGAPAPEDAADLAWRAYLSLLEEVAGNVTASDYGRRFPAVFWLYQSEVVARWLSRCPARALELDPEIGHDGGDRDQVRGVRGVRARRRSRRCASSLAASPPRASRATICSRRSSRACARTC